MSQSAKNIRALSEEEMQIYFEEIGEKKFRAKQVYEWIWKKSAKTFDEMTNLSLEVREKLKSHFVLKPAIVKESQISNDKTIKSSFELYDGELVEGVLIPADDRMTACVSSQVGCSLSCKFCATGYMNRKRNLEADEIYDQVVLIAEQAESHYQHRLTNIVYMGMGEPLLNYKNVLQSIHMITSPEGLDWSPKRITLSTAGIAKMIKKLGDDEVKFNLALSLHAANDAKRDKIMPINEQNSLDALAESLQYFYKKTGNRITFEYIIFNNFNDEIQDAKELVDFCKKVPAKVNIIEYNPIEMADFVNAAEDKVDKFAEYLREHKVVVNVRRSRGKDIDAACGQLAIKSK